MTGKQLMEAAELTDRRIRETRRMFHELIVGRKVRILSEYNGQPYGRSQPSQKGRVCMVKGTSHGPQGWTLQLEEFAYGHPFIPISEVEILDIV